jgi:predicted regulator of Ras-like GTPase activity (Roadblock/LC7/MglB family)
MASPSMVILEQDYERFMEVLGHLLHESNSKFVFLIDKAGQQIACCGEMQGVDATSLASLTAGNVAATEGVAQLVGEPEFSNLYHEGKRDNLHMTVIADRVILLVVFDERSSLGLVRLRVQQHAPALADAVNTMLQRGRGAQGTPAGTDAAFTEITDADIEALFG